MTGTPWDAGLCCIVCGAHRSWAGLASFFVPRLILILPFRRHLLPLHFLLHSGLPDLARWLPVLQTGEEKTDKKKEEAAQRHKAAEQYIQTPHPCTHTTPSLRGSSVSGERGVHVMVLTLAGRGPLWRQGSWLTAGSTGPLMLSVPVMSLQYTALVAVSFCVHK